MKKFPQNLNILFLLMIFFTYILLQLEAVSMQIPFSTEKRESTKITILHFNDTHSHLTREEDPENLGGFARIKTYIDSVRNECENLIVLHDGDFFEGTIYFNLNAGVSDLEVLNTLGINTAVLGNHDWIFGVDNLVNTLKTLPPNFKILSSNLEYPPGGHELEQFVDEYQIMNIGGITFGLFGLSTYEYIYDYAIAPILILDPYPVAKAAVDALEPIADYIICLSHMGLSDDLELPAAAPGINLVVSGHSSDKLYRPLLFKPPEIREPMLIVHAGELGKFIGRIDLEFDSGTHKLLSYDYDLVQMDQEIPEDAQILSLIEDYKKDLINIYGHIFDDAFARTAVNLQALTTETFFVNMVTDAFREAANAEMSIESSNFLSGNIQNGIIDTEDLYNAIAHVYKPESSVNWEVHTMEVQGFDLKFLMGLLLRLNIFQLSVSGAEIIYDPENMLVPIKSFKINGENINLFKNYKVSCNEGIVIALDVLGGYLGKQFYKNLTNTHQEGWRVVKKYIQTRYSNSITYKDAHSETKSRVRSIDTDLSISPEDILFSPSTAKPGEKVTVNIRIRNVGNKVSSGNYRVHLSIDKTPDYFSDDPNKLELSLLNGSSLIQPGGYIDYKTDINIPAWTTPMQYPIYVDVTDESKDKIIGNNSTRTFFTVSSKYGSGKM